MANGRPAAIRRGHTPCEVDASQETKTYRVLGMHCAHCEAAVTRELEAVEGVTSATIRLESGLATVTGSGLDDAALRAAIREAGYEVAA